MRWSKAPKPHGEGEVQVMNMSCLFSTKQARHEKKRKDHRRRVNPKKKEGLEIFSDVEQVFDNTAVIVLND